MNRFLFILIPILVLLILGTVFYNLYQSSLPTAQIRDHKFSLLTAKSNKDKQIGLSKHKKLEDNKGMIFVFDKPGLYPFWMKDMKFPIDIIYINQNKIVTIYKNLPKDNLRIYSPTQSADKVLEINANLSKKYGFNVDDTVTFKNLK